MKSLVQIYIPSMSTLRASFSTLSVENRTRIQKRNVQMGSAIVHSGCDIYMCVCVCVCVCAAKERVTTLTYQQVSSDHLYLTMDIP